MPASDTTNNRSGFKGIFSSRGLTYKVVRKEIPVYLPPASISIKPAQKTARQADSEVCPEAIHLPYTYQTFARFTAYATSFHSSCFWVSVGAQPESLMMSSIVL